MLELCMWIIVHLGSALGALLVIAFWVVIIFWMIDEIASVIRETRNNPQDGDPS